MFDHGDVLQSLAVLLGALGAVQSGALIGGIKSLLDCMLSFGHAMKYMAAHTEPTTTITRSLLQVVFWFLILFIPFKWKYSLCSPIKV